MHLTIVISTFRFLEVHELQYLTYIHKHVLLERPRQFLYRMERQGVNYINAAKCEVSDLDVPRDAPVRFAHERSLQASIIVFNVIRHSRKRVKNGW